MTRKPQPADKDYMMSVLAETREPLFPSEIAERLNVELGSGKAYTMTEVVMLLKTLDREVEQLPDGRWTLGSRIIR